MIADGLWELPPSQHFVGGLPPYGLRILPRLSGASVRRLRLTGIGGWLRLLARGALVRRIMACLSPSARPAPHSPGGTRLLMLTYHGCSLLPGAAQYLRTEADRQAFLAPLAGYLQFSLVEFGGRADSVTRVASGLASGHNASSV